MATDYGWKGLSSPRKDTIEEIKAENKRQNEELRDITVSNRIGTVLSCLTIALATATLMMADLDENKKEIEEPKIEQKITPQPVEECPHKTYKKLVNRYKPLMA